jgi:hypothetical protein
MKVLPGIERPDAQSVRPLLQLALRASHVNLSNKNDPFWGDRFCPATDQYFGR